MRKEPDGETPNLDRLEDRNFDVEKREISLGSIRRNILMASLNAMLRRNKFLSNRELLNILDRGVT